MALTDLVQELSQRALLSSAAVEAAKRIIRSFRNDVHHMNPAIARIDFPALAKRNLQDLAAVEREIFETSNVDGALIPKNPQFWDLQPDGTLPVFLRIEP